MQFLENKTRFRGIMATYTILLNQLGMPLDSVGMLMIANVFFVNMETALGMVIRDLNLLDLASQKEGSDH